jgi:hypothetical protein
MFSKYKASDQKKSNNILYCSFNIFIFNHCHGIISSSQYYLITITVFLMYGTK